VKPVEVEVDAAKVGLSAAPLDALPLTVAEPGTKPVFEVKTVTVELAPAVNPVTVTTYCLALEE